MHERLRPLESLLADALGFLRYLAGRLIEDRCQQTAAALTWVTLFALVPLLTVFYSILSLVPAFHSLGGQIQDLVFRHFVPATGSEIQQYLTSFADQARKLTVAGTLMLVVSAWLMLRTIEQTFNHIWRVRESRRGVARFVLYWAVLSLGPLLLGAGLLVSTYLFSLSVFTDLLETAQLKSLLLRALPEILGFVTFTLMFIAVPNCRVRLRHAALGGLVSTVLFESGKALLGWVVAKSTYTLIYGAFAALPLFLLWLYMSWLILLAGAEFVYALANYRGQREQQLPDLLVALAVLERACRLHRDGGTFDDTDVLGRRWLFGRYTVDPARWESIRLQLLDARLLCQTEGGGYVLGTATDSVSLWSLYRLVGAPSSLPALDATGELPGWYRTAHAMLLEAQSGIQATLDRSLRDLFTRDGDDVHDRN